MTPYEFLRKWRNVELKERSASQSHFNDLCALLDLPDPISADPTGSWFTFEKGANKTSGGNGWADVWRRECFGWEYKGRHANLDKAYAQLLQYSVALENPPLLIVSDMDRIGAHYTDRDKIMMIVRPVVIAPLEAEWARTLAQITALIETAPRQTKDKLLRGAELGKRTSASASPHRAPPWQRQHSVAFPLPCSKRPEGTVQVLRA